MGEGEFVAGLASVVEWLNTDVGTMCVIVWVIGFVSGMYLCWCIIQNMWTIKPKSNKRNIDAAIAKEREQLRTASSTHTLCFGCMFEIIRGLECWSCVRRSNLKDNFRARRVGGGVG